MKAETWSQTGIRAEDWAGWSKKKPDRMCEPSWIPVI